MESKIKETKKENTKVKITQSLWQFTHINAYSTDRNKGMQIILHNP